MLIVLDLVRFFQGGSWGHGGLKPRATPGHPRPRRGAVKGIGRDGALSKGKKNAQTGMGFKLCLIAPLGKRVMRC